MHSLKLSYERYEQAVNEPGVVGHQLPVPPDCLPDDVDDYPELNVYACESRTWLANDFVEETSNFH